MTYHSTNFLYFLHNYSFIGSKRTSSSYPEFHLVFYPGIDFRSEIYAECDAECYPENSTLISCFSPRLLSTLYRIILYNRYAISYHNIKINYKKLVCVYIHTYILPKPLPKTQSQHPHPAKPSQTRSFTFHFPPTILLLSYSQNSII